MERKIGSNKRRFELSGVDCIVRENVSNSVVNKSQHVTTLVEQHILRDIHPWDY